MNFFENFPHYPFYCKADLTITAPEIVGVLAVGAVVIAFPTVVLPGAIVGGLTGGLVSYFKDKD